MDPDEFLDKGDTIAVVGVSTDRMKWGSRIYRTLKSLGFYAHPINPKHKRIGSDPCYPSLAAMPKRPDVVITAVPPTVTENIVRECIELGIGKVWMQPGSESEKAINLCGNNNIKTIYNVCFVADGLKEEFTD